MNNIEVNQINKEQLMNDEEYFRMIEKSLNIYETKLSPEMESLLAPAWFKWNQKISRGDTDQEEITGELTKFGFAKFFDQISQLFMRN
jgi:hypothetical protein